MTQQQISKKNQTKRKRAAMVAIEACEQAFYAEPNSVVTGSHKRNAAYARWTAYALLHSWGWGVEEAARLMGVTHKIVQERVRVWKHNLNNIIAQDEVNRLKVETAFFNAKKVMIEKFGPRSTWDWLELDTRKSRK